MRPSKPTMRPSAGRSMGRRWIVSSITLVAVCVVAFPQSSVTDCRDDEPWICNEREIGCYYPDWMARLDGSLLISEISIPGTHETMASERGGFPVYCQSVQDLRLQLDAGIRALDIRCRHAQNRFAIHHGAYYQEAWFGEPYVTNEGDKNVMQMCVQFLYDNPTEFILMYIAETHTEGHCNRSFAETFEWYRNEDGCDIETLDGDSAIQYKDFIWTTSDYAPDEYPTVDEVRGKIVILQNFASRYLVGNAPYHVITADLDKDGYEDIITVVTDDDKLCIQMSGEHGSITNKKYLSTGNMPREVCAADFNNDGWLDLAASNWENEVEIFENNGLDPGNFLNPISYNVKDEPMGIAAGDLNNDNLPDVAVACQGSDFISVMYNGYNEIPGKFRTVHYKSGQGPRDVCITDLNMDGWNDIGYVKFANLEGHDYMAILTNNKNSSGGFSGYWDITNNAPQFAYAIATGDFNADGCPDLLATGTKYGKVKVATCSGNGANYDFKWHDCGKGPRDAAVGDFNEDGWPDFAIAKYENYPSWTRNFMAVFLNEGCGNSHFLPYEDYYTADDPEGMWTADLDNDGHLDLITTGKSERCTEIFDGNGKGKFFIARYGLPWSNFSIQNNYQMTCTAKSFNDKEKAIKSKIDEARQGAPETLYINFTSGAQGVNPLDVANGCGAYKGMNQRTYNYLRGFLPDNPGRCGVIMMDYPGPGLIEVIIKQNKFMVYLDIKPGSCPNPLSINIPEKGKPVLPVAVLGTPDFDVSTIDPSTVRLEQVEPLSSRIKDVSTPPDPVSGDCAGTGNGHGNRQSRQSPIIDPHRCRYSCTSEGTDGYPDLTLRFLKADIVNAIADQADQGQVFLKLTGALYDGTLIEGTDRIDLRGKPGSSTKNSASETTLQGNYPNPFNPATEISFTLSEATRVKLQIFNILGQEVTTLIDGHMEAGSHTVMWDGNKVASGIYLYRLQAGDVVETKKMLLLK